MILCQCEKTFSMWFFMIFSGRMFTICIFFFLRCNVIKTFRSKKISPPFLPVTFWNSYGIIQFWMRIMRRKNIILCSSPLKAPIADAKTAGSLVIWPPACYLFNQYFNLRHFPALISHQPPGRYRILSNNFHLPPTESDDLEPEYGTLPGGDAYGLPWQLLWRSLPAVPGS